MTFACYALTAVTILDEDRPNSQDPSRSCRKGSWRKKPVAGPMSEEGRATDVSVLKHYV